MEKHSLGDAAMSIGPAGFYSIIAATAPQTSALGAAQTQTQSADFDRTAQEVAEQAREHDSETKAENAEGVGQTDGEEHGTNQRDADGRRLWEKNPAQSADEEKTEEQPSEDSDDEASDPPHASRDATGQSGSQLDLMG
jgi:hypothetical protein